MPRLRSPLPLALPLLAVATLALGGCAASTAAPEPASSGTAASAVTVDNCGTEVTFEAAPERVITIKSTSTEAMLALGLGDRIIGTGFQDGPVPTEWADAAAGIPSLSDFVPGQEAVLAAEPDFVFGGWESNFAADGAGERGTLEDLGVHTYVSPAACKEPGYQPEKLGFDDIFGEIEELASIFRVDATDLVTEQQAIVDGIEPSTAGHTALWYSSGDDVPYVGAGIGAPELVMETVGLTNIAADVDDTWTSLSWEAVVDADPDVIVLVDATWNTAESKIAALEANPATANLDAVKNQRYLTIPFPAGEAGVRTAPAAADLATQLAAISF